MFKIETKFDSKKFAKDVEKEILENAKKELKKDLEKVITPFKSEIANAGGRYKVTVTGRTLKDLQGKIELDGMAKDLEDDLSKRIQANIK